MMASLLKLSVVLFLYSSTVLGSPTINIDTKYYAIYGLNSKELRKEMNAKSSIKQYGNTFDAYTSWYVNWRFKWDTNSSQCYMTNVTSTVDVNFTLPKWVNRDDSNSTLIRKWDQYHTALIDHENGHKDIGVNAAKEIESQLLKLSSSNCSSLERKANTLGKKILNEYIAIEKEYDKETNHGMNNGTKFP